MYRNISDNYQNSITFRTPTNRSQKFKIGGDASLACSLSGTHYFALSIQDGNIQEDFSAPHSKPELISSPMMSGVGIINRNPKLRTRVVTYKLLIISPRTIWSDDNQTWLTGRGAKQRTRDFIREFLDVGDLNVQYGTWGGVDFGGYLVDEPQVTYNSEETQATVTFTLQFVNPVTLHPNFTNSRLWSSESEQINWTTLDTADNGNLKSVTATRNTTTGALTATFRNVYRWSNIGFLCTTATGSATKGTLTVTQGAAVLSKRFTTIYTASEGRTTLFLGSKVYYASVTSTNQVGNLSYWSAASNNCVGISAIPPCVTATVTFTPDTASATGRVAGRFILLGW